MQKDIQKICYYSIIINITLVTTQLLVTMKDSFGFRSFEPVYV